jgi:endonuclease G
MTMKPLLRHAAVFLALLVPSFCLAYQTNPDDNIRFGAPEAKGRLMHKQGFTLMYDPVKKNPVWVSYHIKKENITTGDPKAGAFRTDASLPVYERVSRDELGAKYDKCPMAPVIDMSYSQKTHDEAFLLSNICQMNSLVKKDIWRPIEDSVRSLVKEAGEAWVVSGPVFEYGTKRVIRAGSGKVAVPTGFYKAVLYQSKDGSFHSIGFYTDNKKVQGAAADFMTSVAAIEARTGLKFFTVLPQEVQNIIKKQKSLQ